MEKTKKKLRFNIVDLIIIILVIAAVTAGVCIFLGSKLGFGKDGNEKKKISYVLQLSELRDIYVDNIQNGDDAYDADTDKYLGKVVSVSSEATTRIGTDKSTGNMVVSEIEGRVDLFVTLENEAEYYDGQYFIDGIPVVVGGVVTFACPELLAPANFISVEILD